MFSGKRNITLGGCSVERRFENIAGKCRERQSRKRGFVAVKIAFFFVVSIRHCGALFVLLENIRQQVEVETKRLLAEVEAERSHHQKMLKDYDRLQQRFENLQDEVEILQSPQKDQGKPLAFM